MRLLADVGLVDGHPGIADWCFLIAAVLFIVSAVIERAPRRETNPVVRYPWLGNVLTAVGLALVALGWLVL